MGKFSAVVKDWGKRSIKSLEVISQTVKIEMFSRLIYRSPVGNPDLWEVPAPKGYVGGRFRANWNIDETLVTENIDPNGAETEARMQSAIFAAPAFSLTSYINALPYAEPIEYGHSKKQAPEGVLRIAALEFPDVVAAVVAAENRG